ncbi:peptide-methionine (R)-S-oxide reductase MsrB [Flavobacterium sp. Sd200]|uniref:peptide-methionine (R)-S-oxide reductase MsrB n=1 Tax=Flavobacterium sp. Sd200 TaxID=2692211 RepID=UPI00136DE053|nr:peptide-methionine (R)-S-oxide reductase MsrB [Flavobacterium sp. Sd200]MXN93180.1 peptide-methionine (R)-S-oxide reductase MsrB [Flavobacterium sp. Sd200]
MKKILMMMTVLITLTACQGQEKKVSKNKTVKTETKTKGKFAVTKTDAEWQSQLTPQQYSVLRNKDTERPYTGEYDNFFEKGMYVCAACGNPLFNSNTKFNSHCGWPSFDQAIKGSVIYEEDNSLGMERTEVMCAKCGGHLGHVFDDGPKETTGQRFCTNSVSIKFIPSK